MILPVRPPAGRLQWRCALEVSLVSLVSLGLLCFLLYEVLTDHTIHEPPFRGCAAVRRFPCPYDDPAAAAAAAAAAADGGLDTGHAPPPAVVAIGATNVSYCLDGHAGYASWEVQAVDWWNLKGFRTAWRGSADGFTLAHPEFPVLPATPLRVRARGVLSDGSMSQWSPEVDITTNECGYCGNGADMAVYRQTKTTMKPAIQGCIISCATKPTCTQECIGECAYLCFSVSLCLYLSVSLSLCLSVLLSHSLIVCFPLCASLSLSLSLSLCGILSLCPPSPPLTHRARRGLERQLQLVLGRGRRMHAEKGG